MTRQKQEKLDQKSKVSDRPIDNAQELSDEWTADLVSDGMEFTLCTKGEYKPFQRTVEWVDQETKEWRRTEKMYVYMVRNEVVKKVRCNTPSRKALTKAFGASTIKWHNRKVFTILKDFAGYEYVELRAKTK